ncbi:MAG: Ppx/GppA family phosphatase [Rhodospirillales bacterium]|nr:Ppx/GppA family phosphatase [Rhodospirillales bacterium]
MDGAPFAALDLGTNNCRLLVAESAPGGFRVVDAFSRIVRLGERLSATGELALAAMDRTVEALHVCAGKLRRRGVGRYRGVATEACRQARNGGAFVARVAAETGIEFEIIDPQEEIGLALAGCASLLSDDKPHAILFDIGGGSTEVTWLARCQENGWVIVDTVSLTCGVVSFAERFGGDRVTAEGYGAMVDEIAARLTPFEARHDIARRVADGAVQMVGTSGTVTTLAGVRMNLPRYDRALVDGSWLCFDEISAVNRDLAALDWDARAAHPCIGPERADLVVAGCAILDAICRLWPVGRLRVADRGLREGILLGLMREAGLGRAGAGLNGAA